jgi:hypothetical protein
MLSWINQNKKSIIRLAFLVPILSVAIISISHVVKWYSLANPISWAIYLSIAIEIAALSSIAAASVKVKGFSVWFVFIIVTLIQFIGNIYFSFSEINISSKEFKDWAELTGPLFESFSDIEDSVAQRRLLAILEGGLLPLISLTCLHFFIQYEDGEEPLIKPTDEQPSPITHVSQEPSPNTGEKIDVSNVWNTVDRLKKEGKLPDSPTSEELENEPSALAFTPYEIEEEPDSSNDNVIKNVIFAESSPIKNEPSIQEESSNLDEEPQASPEKKNIRRGFWLTKRPFSNK